MSRPKINYLIVAILIFTAVAIATGIILQVNTERITNKTHAGNDQALRLSQVHSEIQRVMTDMISVESKVRALVITSDESVVTGVQDTMLNLKYDLSNLQKMALNDSNRQSFVELSSLIDRKISYNNELLNIYYHKGKAAAEENIATKRGTVLRDSIILVSGRIEKDLQARLQNTLKQNSDRAETVVLISRLLTWSTLIAILILSTLIIRRLRKQQGLIKLLELANKNEAEARLNMEKVSADILDLYNNAPCGYHSLDKDAFFISMNDTELKWLGYTREEVIGKMRVFDVLDKESEALIRQNFPNFKKHGFVKERRLTFVTKSGASFPALLNSIAIFDDQGDYVASRSTIFDITGQQKNEVALKEAKRQADESAAIKEQFLANMSHEIRTPINGVIGFTNLLQKTSLSEDQQQFVTLIQAASENLLTIINDILDISKIEAGMLRIEKNPFSLRGMCSSIETMFYHRLREKSLAFSIHIQDNIPDTLKGDAVRLTQILVNLISNAIKFTQEGGVNFTIRTTKKEEDKIRLLFSVKDTGIGIPAGKIDSIFERFQQGETDTTRKYGGTGLGLSIVKNLIELQEGKISVMSEVEKGTEFLFEIEYELISMDQKAAMLSNGTHIDPATFRNARILVVEDNQMNQLLIKYTFKGWHLNYELAENGKEAIEWLKRESFSLVLLDIQMPVMDGYLAAQTIRNELKSNVPIIAMTAHAMPGEREKCLSYGMNDYISKPIIERELFRLLEKYLSKENGNVIASFKSNLHYIDFAFLHDLVMGNSEFMKRVITQFIKQFPGEMDALKEAIEKKDKKTIAALAHHIQSTVSVLGKNTPFFQQLEKLEKLALDSASPAGLSTEFTKLEGYKHSLLQETNLLLHTELP